MNSPQQQIQLTYETPKKFTSNKKLDFETDVNVGLTPQVEDKNGVNNLHLIDFSKFKTNTPIFSSSPYTGLSLQKTSQSARNIQWSNGQSMSGRQKLVNRINGGSMEVETPLSDHPVPQFRATDAKRLFQDQDELINATPKKVCLNSPIQTIQQNNPVKRNLFSDKIVQPKFDDLVGDYQNFEQIDSRFSRDYTQLSVIGHGNFGTVYKCRNNYDNHIYAIKCTKSKYRITNGHTEAANEAQALAFLSAKGDNPYIVRYFTSWTEGNALYLAMELCDSSVYRIQKEYQESNNSFREAEIKQILRDVTEGLKYLHFLQLVHLDIKPDNILYSESKKNFKIADLGMSRSIMLKYGEDVNEGDARYLAPELLKDSEVQTAELAKSDIFSLGSSMLELILNEDLPKNGLRWHQLRQGLTDEDFGLYGSNFSQALKDLIKQMMQPDYQKRPTAIEILQNQYFKKEKESSLKWEKIRGQLLRKQLEQLTNKQGRKKSL